MLDRALLYVTPDESADGDLVEQLRSALADVTVRTAGSIEEAERAVREDSVDCVVTAYRLSDGTGVDLLDRVQARAPDTACVLFTGADREEIDLGSLDDLLIEYVRKDAPDAADRLVRIVRTTLDLGTHTGYPLPDDEAGRLAALDRLDLDDDGLHDAVDRITTLAARHFDLPLSAVGVITAHTEQFLVSYGADWADIPREDTVCTYTILEDDLLVIEDLTEDLRFADNDAVEDLDIRFYAGAPLRIGGDDPVGTLCVYDYEPREFDEEDREYLRLLAEEVVDQLVLRSRRDAGAVTGRASSGETDE